MVASIYVQALNEIKNIKFPFKFLRNCAKWLIINKAVRKIQKEYLSGNEFTAKHIMNFCQLFSAAKLGDILENNIVSNNLINVSGILIDVCYKSEFSIIRIKTDTQDMIYTATDVIKLEYTDIRNKDHSYRYNYSYDIIKATKDNWNDKQSMLESQSFEILYIAFNLILQLVANGLYEKEN